MLIATYSLDWKVIFFITQISQLLEMKGTHSDIQREDPKVMTMSEWCWKKSWISWLIYFFIYKVLHSVLVNQEEFFFF